ncbi:MAG: ATP-binding cassette domain-containing protein [Celeribacter sp.]|jgi:iron complex transport system ATP-binding protein
MIEITGLNHVIGDAPVLHDINLSVPGGGITALIGPNGAGKSTLLHLIAGLEQRRHGRMRIDGAPAETLSRRDFACKLAILTQDTGVASRLTVADLVAFGRWPHCRGRMQGEDHTAVARALEMFDLTELSHRYIDELSGGQRQRAHVAMAYAQETDWLLLDEPLNNLDPRHAQALMARLHRMSRPGPDQRSVVIVIHEVNYAAAWADHVIAMKHGRVQTEGPAETVLTSAALSALYETPIRVTELDGRPVVLHHRADPGMTQWDGSPLRRVI